MAIDKFNVEWSSSCKAKDYLFVNRVAKYTKTWLCGSDSSGISSLTSKATTMIVKFKSNASVRKSGFKVRLIAIG